MTNLERKSYGSFRTTHDGPPTHDTGAQKRLVCSFKGPHFVSERNGEFLDVYCVTDEFGQPADEYRGASDTIRTLADLNKRNAQRRM